MDHEEDAFTTNEEAKEATDSFIEANTHAFVVKVWVEETAVASKEPLWRGHITHVASGQRKYIQSMSHISIFMWPYLQGLSIPLSIRERFCLWLNRHK